MGKEGLTRCAITLEKNPKYIVNTNYATLGNDPKSECLNRNREDPLHRDVLNVPRAEENQIAAYQ